MTVTFLNPAALWLLLLLPLAAGLALAGGRRPTPGRFWLGLGLRLFLMAALVLALAGVQLRLPVDTLAAVFLLDLSDSVPREQQARGEALIRQAVQAMPAGDQAAVVVFGEDALVENLASEERRLPDFASIPVSTRTDIAGALQLGLALFPDEGARRLVLLSDGRQNVGQALEQAEIAASLGVELVYVPLEAPQGEVEVLMESLEAPASLRQGQGFELTAAVRSTAAVGATLRIFQDGRLFFSQEVTLQAGVNRFAAPVDPQEAGFRRYRVQVAPDLDTRLQNNEANAFTVVYGPPRVLVVEGASGEAENLIQALQAGGMTVVRAAPAGVPVSLPELAAYDAIVMVNAPAAGLPSGAMEAIQVAVRDLGKGLLMVGGDQSFGAGGYLRTPLEETLPVDMDVRTREQSPNLALVLAVDKSGSMGRCHCDDPDLNQTYTAVESGQPKVDIAKAAVLQAASALGEQDYLGVVAFDSIPRWALEVRRLVDALALEQSIGGIRAEGQTNVQAGVEAAFDSLQGAQARLKHVILLTDGWTRGGDLLALAHEMREQGITLSVVAAGGGSAEYLKEMAQAGGGRYYPAEDILDVPEFFLKETIQAVGRYINEAPFYPLPVEAGSPVLRGLDARSLPLLLGYNGATAKQTARIALSSPSGDPLLATWQYGLGRAAAWTTDLKGQWAADWIAWQGFPRFAAQLVGWVLPAPQVEGVEAGARLENGQAVFSLEAVDEQGLPRNFLQASAAVVDPELNTRTIELPQVGPGLYEARLEAAAPGAYLAQVSLRQGEQVLGQQLVGIAVPYSPEYRASGVDLALLESLAGLTGGAALLQPEAAFVHNLPAAARARPIWEPLLWLAALLFPLDIAIRRVVLGRREVRKALDWLQSRLPRRPGRGAAAPQLERLFQARQRSRARRSGAPTRPAGAAERPPGSQANLPESTAGPPKPAAEAPEAPSTPPGDTLERLRAAKERTRRGGGT